MNLFIFLSMYKQENVLVTLKILNGVKLFFKYKKNSFLIIMYNVKNQKINVWNK